VLVVVGGVVVPLTRAPHWLHVIGEFTPAGALSIALHAVLQAGTAPSALGLAVLAGWIVVGWAGTVRWFQWQ
jgi:ABC-2 type transport system permease protein